MVEKYIALEKAYKMDTQIADNSNGKSSFVPPMEMGENVEPKEIVIVNGDEVIKVNRKYPVIIWFDRNNRCQLPIEELQKAVNEYVIKEAKSGKFADKPVESLV